VTDEWERTNDTYGGAAAPPFSVAGSKQSIGSSGDRFDDSRDTRVRMEVVMTAGSTVELEAKKQRAAELIATGKSSPQIAAEVGLHVSTVRRLRERLTGRKRRNARKATRPKAETKSKRPSALEMLRGEAPDVYRVLLDAAKGGDIRAATLVVRLLGNSLGEATDDGDTDAARDELERGLQSLPSDIASEVAGLLAEAHRRRAGRTASASAGESGGGVPAAEASPAGGVSVEAEDRPPDEGADSV
jgi:transposase